MTQTEYAAHRKLTKGRISQLVKSGVIVMAGNRVDVAASDAVLDDRPVLKDAGRAVESDEGEVRIGRTYNDAKTAAAIFDAKTKRLNLLEREGSLIEVGSVRRVWSHEIGRAKQSLLNVADELGDHLAVERDPVKCRAMLRGKLTQIMTELSRSDGAVLA